MTDSSTQFDNSPTPRAVINKLIRERDTATEEAAGLREALTQVQASIAKLEELAYFSPMKGRTWQDVAAVALHDAHVAEAEAAALRTALEQAQAAYTNCRSSALAEGRAQGAAAQQKALAQAQAELAAVVKTAAFIAEDRLRWEAEAATLRNTNIVLQAESEVGQQVRELVTAISRDGETVVGAVQRIMEQAQATAKVDTYTPILWATMTDDQRYAEYAGLRAQVQAFQWQPIETAPEATYVLVRVPNYGINIATMTRDPNILGPNGAYWFIRGDNDPCKPTHWMPIPAFDALLSSVSLPGGEPK